MLEAQDDFPGSRGAAHARVGARGRDIARGAPTATRVVPPEGARVSLRRQQAGAESHAFPEDIQVLYGRGTRRGTLARWDFFFLEFRLLSAVGLLVCRIVSQLQGNLARQEAVSMIPALLLGVESHHFVCPRYLLFELVSFLGAGSLRSSWLKDWAIVGIIASWIAS